ncbi:MAG: hypothetical protein ACD_17C00148G0003, partial [uncultured bacterium]
MKKWFVLLILCGACAWIATIPKQKKNSFIDFDQAMSKNRAFFTECYQGKRALQWTLLKHLYEKHLSKTPSKVERIPKKIHQIWLGGTLPDRYRALQTSWQKHHPEWEYHLWTDADVETFPFSNKERFEKAMNVGEKSDILRYEILSQFGGLYVDTDFECIQPFDSLHFLCDFYVGLETPHAKDTEAAIGNALIGSIPHHPILQACLHRIAKKKAGKTADEVQDISGPGCLRYAFFKCCKKNSLHNIAFPYTFFYPLP